MKLADLIDLGVYKRVGITTRPADRKQEHTRRFVKLSDWKQQGPFPSREAAQAWEDEHDESWEHHPGGAEPDDAEAEWYGYTFCHEGERPKSKVE